jgi:acetyltransferase-like isoleucine patch superfamily enzyme
MILKSFLLFLEYSGWNIRCRYNFWLHGPYGLSKVIEKMPFRFVIIFLRRYGATIGENCRFERGLNIHRPMGRKPFENLVIGNHVYLGHNTLIDLSRKVTLRDRVIIASRCQIWTHASHYDGNTVENPLYGEYFGEIMIEEGALIYSNVVITHGTTIGKFARVGANSVVNKNIGPFVFAGGVPAKEIRR